MKKILIPHFEHGHFALAHSIKSMHNTLHAISCMPTWGKPLWDYHEIKQWDFIVVCYFIVNLVLLIEVDSMFE